MNNFRRRVTTKEPVVRVSSERIEKNITWNRVEIDHLNITSTTAVYVYFWIYYTLVITYKDTYSDGSIQYRYDTKSNLKFSCKFTTPDLSGSGSSTVLTTNWPGTTATSGNKLTCYYDYEVTDTQIKFTFTKVTDTGLGITKNTSLSAIILNR